MPGAFYEWAAESISAERLALEVAYGFALALLHCATEKSTATLKAEIIRLEGRLAAYSRHDESKTPPKAKS